MKDRYLNEKTCTRIVENDPDENNGGFVWRRRLYRVKVGRKDD